MMMKILLSFVLLFVLFACESPGDEGKTLNYLTYQEDYVIETFRSEPTGAYEGRQEIKAIGSIEELETYYQEHKDSYDLSSFKAYIETLDERRFEDSALLIIVLEEPSGSIHHGVKDLFMKNGTLMVELYRDVPEIGTTDMACWHILLEVSKTNHAFDDIELYVE